MIESELGDRGHYLSTGGGGAEDFFGGSLDFYENKRGDQS